MVIIRWRAKILAMLGVIFIPNYLTSYINLSRSLHIMQLYSVKHYQLRFLLSDIIIRQVPSTLQKKAHFSVDLLV